MQRQTKDHGNKLHRQQLQPIVDLNQEEIMDKNNNHRRRYLLMAADKNQWFDKTIFFLFDVCFKNNILILNKFIDFLGILT